MAYSFLLVLFFLQLCVSFAYGAESNMIDAAKKEGAMVFYTTMDIQNSKPLLDAFNKKYPFIKADLFRLGGTAMVSRILTEAPAGRCKLRVSVRIPPPPPPQPDTNA